MGVEHDFFGFVESTPGGGLSWRDTVESGDQAVDVELVADDADTVEPVGLDLAASMIRHLEAFDDRARDALVSELSERQSATSGYIDDRLDAGGQTLVDLMVDASGDIAIDVLKSLQLLRVTLHPENADDDAPFAEFEYSLEPDDVDDLLIVTFSSSGDVVDVQRAD